MEEIQNYNCAGLCMEKTCDKPQTQFIQVCINDMEFLIGFCDEHAEQFEMKYVRSLIQKEKKKEEVKICQ